MATTRPKRNQRQKDGSRQQWSNCAAAAQGTAVLRHLKNVNPLKGYPWNTRTLPTMSSAIRRWCNSHFDTTTARGLRQSWVRAAAKAMYGVSMGYYWGPGSGDSIDTQWRKFVAFVIDGRGVTVSVTYSAIVGTRYSGFGSFYGRHRWYVNERRWNATKGRYEFLVYGPEHDARFSWVPNGDYGIWVPSSILKRAMLLSGIEVSYTRDTEG